MAMPIYVYETTDPSKPVRQFELKQSMSDEPLKTDPATGEPVRRDNTPAKRNNQKPKPNVPAAPVSSCCKPGGCGCH